MTLDSVRIPPASKISATLSGSWKRPRYWDWNGTLTASEPIVGLSLMQIGERLEWARSEKGPKSILDIRLLLGFDVLDKSNVYVSFCLGENLTRWRTLLDDPDKPPLPPETCSVPIGRVFPFCESFGTPKIHLFGLVLLRSQVVCARKGLWHLKSRLREQLPAEWARILSYGRKGFVGLESSSQEIE
jgi:hypothetical protein